MAWDINRQKAAGENLFFQDKNFYVLSSVFSRNVLIVLQKCTHSHEGRMPGEEVCARGGCVEHEEGEGAGDQVEHHDEQRRPGRLVS